MEDIDRTAKSLARKRAKAPVVISDSAASIKRRPLLKQGTTWAGLLSIAAAVATNGASVLTEPATLAAIGSGLALLFAEN